MPDLVNFYPLFFMYQAKGRNFQNLALLVLYALWPLFLSSRVANQPMFAMVLSIPLQHRDGSKSSLLFLFISKFYKSLYRWLFISPSRLHLRHSRHWRYFWPSCDCCKVRSSCSQILLQLWLFASLGFFLAPWRGRTAEIHEPGRILGEYKWLSLFLCCLAWLIIWSA